MNALESRRARWVHRAVLVALSALFLAPLASWGTISDGIVRAMPLNHSAT